jgi:hypothetical protein
MVIGLPLFHRRQTPAAAPVTGSFGSLLRCFGVLRMDGKQPVSGHVCKAPLARSRLDRFHKAGWHPATARPFVNGLDIGPDLTGKNTAAWPAGDQSVNGVRCVHAGQNGRFFQKRKMENSSMGIFSRIRMMTA